jgi:hypothetical protein
MFNTPLAADATSAGVTREDGGAAVTTAVAVDASNPRRLTVRLLNPAVGAYQLHWHAVAAEAPANASEGDQAFALQNESPTPARIDISPATVEVGDRLELVGKGFRPGSPMQLTIGDDAQPLTTTETDARGTFNVETKLPDSVPFGMQPITAADTDGHNATGAVQVHWGGWPPAVATNTGQPGPGPGEITFTLAVRNRSDYVLEHVQVVMKDPDAATLVVADPGAQRQEDTMVWQIPVMPRGTYGPYHATYRADTGTVSHAWLLFRHRHARGCAGGSTCVPAFISESTADSAGVAPAQ